jgi:hypothetical protein
VIERAVIVALCIIAIALAVAAVAVTALAAHRGAPRRQEEP